MSEPIPFTTTRYRCPHCPRTAASKTRMRGHIGRCWYSPDTQGCKTCKHFNPPWSEEGDECAVGVSLDGQGHDFDIDYVRAGPITDCPKWEAPSPEGVQ